jgi:hypothetical protein
MNEKAKKRMGKKRRKKQRERKKTIHYYIEVMYVKINPLPWRLKVIILNELKVAILTLESVMK